MKNVALAAIVLSLSVAAVGCATPRINTDSGFGVQFEPAVGLARVQEGEAVSQEAIVALAERVDGGEAVIANLEENSEALAQKDITDSEWFWLLLAGMGIPLVKPANRGVRALAAKLSPPAKPAA